MDGVWRGTTRRFITSGPPVKWSGQGATSANGGYSASMKRAGPNPATLIANRVNPVSGYREGKNMLSSHSLHPTGIVCFTDQLAFGALPAASELGIGVSGGLSITGYDGIDLSRYANPSRTISRIDPNVVG